MLIPSKSARFMSWGRKHHHNELEIMLVECLKDKNSRGIVYQGSDLTETQSVFKASIAWVEKIQDAQSFYCIKTTNNITQSFKQCQEHHSAIQVAKMS
jgi:hypothetical protein